jgi:biotin transport system substrate-specific component
LFGPTAGYLFGFILAALFIGHVVDSNIKARGFIGLIALISFANFVLIFVPGTLWLYVWLNLLYPATIWDAVMMGYLPFIPGDVVKVLGAGTLAYLTTPKTAYNG